MKHHYKQLPTRIPGYALCSAVLGPWSLHGIARHLYPRLKEELQKQYYPETTNFPLLWWGAWLIVGAISPIFSSETHALTAAILYILSGWLQAILCYFIIRLYPQGLPMVTPTYRHYKLNECMEVWLPATIALPLLLLAGGCGVGTCLLVAFLVAVVAVLLSVIPFLRR